MAGTLGAEVEVALNASSACRTARNDRLTQQEVQNRTDSPRHDETDGYPEAQAHAPAWSVLAHVPDHEHVEGRQRAPGERKVETEAERGRRMVSVSGQNDPEEILHAYEYCRRQSHSPARNQAHLVGEADSCLYVTQIIRTSHPTARSKQEIAAECTQGQIPGQLQARPIPRLP